MKKTTLFMVALCLFAFATGLQAQVSSAAREKAKQTKAVKPLLNQKGETGIGQLPVNPTVKNYLPNEVTMITRYDMQSNASSENRIHLFEDGTVGAVGMMAHQDDFTDRGTGTNFYDGTAWGPQPAARIESAKAGWPSYAPWGADGEIVVTHHNTLGLIVMTRPTKGTGAWTEAILAGPTGAVDISWPRVVTNGPDHMNIHIIATTYNIYQGLDPYALLYYRSTDGGATWDIQHKVIEGMTSADYLGFGGDNYAWAQPVGDTLAFVFADSWMDLAIMKSYDNGDTWEKIVAWPSQWNLTPVTGEVETFLAPDGTVACALDKHGKAHIAAGLLYAGADVDGSKQWVPKSDGLIYWNEDMPQLPEELDWDELYNEGIIIGWVTDTNVFNVENSQIAWYYNSMTSQPTICVDEDDFIFVIWSGMTMNLDPDNYLLRHLYARGSTDYGQSWTTSIVDLTSDFLFTWSECVFPSVSWNSDDNLYLLFQEDDYAGISLNGAQGAQGQVAIGSNNIKFMNPAKSSILVPIATPSHQKTGISVSQNFPNPAIETTTITVQLDRPGTLSLDVSNTMGQRILDYPKGQCNAGKYHFTIDTRNLAAGVYFYTVTLNGEQVTRKMIVE